MFGQDEARNIPTTHRHHVYEKFKRGDIKTLFLTRIGNEGVDLPNARVIIIASGQGTSETEDAQRFGRALRGVEESKDDRFLYEVYTDTNTVVHLSDDLNREKIYAEKRETFLKNRGYTIRDEIVQDNEEMNVDIITNTFFMTQQIKNYWKANSHSIGLATLPGYAEERLEIGRGTCTYKRHQYKHDNNLIMAEYIAGELGYSLVVRNLRITSTVYQ
jgi:superfamily II DNA or RNA helicase